ncbi:acylneuraminate cytidylyltransferase family protein [Massilia cavernae]|uniref:Acylneuraminate cytidylyltransferase family protein n=1 Tax=Massilia cavernae TaxID=2320864 RepID=A0A418Y6L0_9BURK|nr:acylneuraminate cytidylyltransferase family protein [Massilia cavernae]RJG23855.1 acylneuraminate cytidylyltransferase family protein [Massilia cavernae]
MIEQKRVLALVPARSGSKGLANKNIRPLNGKPLLAWPIEAARASEYVDRVIISTDDVHYAELARAAGADVPFIRPAELASDTAPSIEFILHAIDTLAAGGEHYDYLLLLEPTSPLTEASDIDKALLSLVSQRDRADAIVGVSALVSTHPSFAVGVTQDGLIAPYAVASFGRMPRRQDTEPLFSLDGSLYASTVEALRRERGFCHGRTLPYVTPRHKSFEVDDLLDFICIEAILGHRALFETSDTSSAR